MYSVQSWHPLCLMGEMDRIFLHFKSKPGLGLSRTYGRNGAVAAMPREISLRSTKGKAIFDRDHDNFGPALLDRKFFLLLFIGPSNFGSDNKDHRCRINPDQKKHHPAQHAVKGCHEYRH